MYVLILFTCIYSEISNHIFSYQGDINRKISTSSIRSANLALSTTTKEWANPQATLQEIVPKISDYKEMPSFDLYDWYLPKNVHSLKGVHFLWNCWWSEKDRSKTQPQNLWKNYRHNNGMKWRVSVHVWHAKFTYYKSKYFCPLGPYPSSPDCAWPQLMHEESAPTKWCIWPESMQRRFQPLQKMLACQYLIP